MDTKERSRIEAAGGFVEFNRFSCPPFWNPIDLSTQGEWQPGLVASNGWLCVQDERQAEPGLGAHDQQQLFQWALSQADQIVTCNPDIENAEVESDWDFVILACDGMSFCFLFWSQIIS